MIKQNNVLDNEERALVITDVHDRHLRVIVERERIILQCSGFGGKANALGIGLNPKSDELDALIDVLKTLRRRLQQ